MKTALIAAVTALLVSAGTATAVSRIDGRSIRLHSIPANRLTASAIHTLKGSRGLRGPAGPTGPTGSFSTIDLVQGSLYWVNPGASLQVSVSCPSGEKAISAGAGSYTGSISEVIAFPNTGRALVTVTNDVRPSSIAFNPYVTCVK